MSPPPRLPNPPNLGVAVRRKEMTRMHSEHPRMFYWRAGLGVGILVVVGITTTLLLKNTDLLDLWLNQTGPLAPVYYLVLLMVATILLVPTPILKIFSGALFGFVIGVWVNFIAAFGGGLLAFILGRWLFRGAILKAIEDDSRILKLEEALSEESMRLSILVRLSPIIPDEWLNYLLSVGPVSLRTFMASNISSLIYSVVYSWYGVALGKIIFESPEVTSFRETPVGLILTVVGLLVTLIATVVVTKITIKAVEEAIGNGENGEEE